MDNEDSAAAVGGPLKATRPGRGQASSVLLPIDGTAYFFFFAAFFFAGFFAVFFAGFFAAFFFAMA
jgi:hypothetical protein